MMPDSVNNKSLESSGSSASGTPTQTTKTLVINRFPLVGQSLIEASAGTGKTHTITALYNRLLLAHNTELKHLACDRILVVTFTRAATDELRGRIRQRIRNSFEACLRLQQQTDLEQQPDLQQDEFIRQLQDCGLIESDIINHAELKKLSRWLQANLAKMDEASIFTIHGFCQRMLKQFAFDSGVMFDAELVLDSEQYLQQACDDVWRLQSYHLNTQQGRFLLSHYADPHALLKKFRGWLSRPNMRFIPAPNAMDFSQQWERLQAQFEGIKTQWQQLGMDEIKRIINASDINKRSYSERYLPSWLNKTDQYLNAEFSLPACKELEKFSASHLQEKTSKGNAPEHPLFDDIDAFFQQSKSVGLQLDIAWFQQVKMRYFELLEQAAALTPDDLLRLLSTALEGAQGESLATQIRTLYPVAMIDEFQDTDPQQYAIFNRIYPPLSPTKNIEKPYGLYMIGDPKQAIYGFRGADIFTYMDARRQLQDTQRYTLDTNWRSYSLLVSAVNTLWQSHASPFVFDRDIPFVAVNAKAHNDHNALTLAGHQPEPLQLWYNAEQLSRNDARHRAAKQCAQQIATLIRSDQAQLGETQVQAKDIAVLVRSRKQAGWIRDALAQLHIGSVFLTRDSVFDSQEALDVLAWLNALLNPADERLVRTALASNTQGLDAITLDSIFNDEHRWESELQTIQKIHQCWQKRGIMAAIMLWLERYSSLAVRLKQSQQGERALTNIIHLGELLQAASRRLRGQQALVRWFSERIFDEEREGEEAQLRLETDANLVTIVTIHKSKGLEYPLVFLPFVWEDSFIPHQQSEAQYYQGYDNDSAAQPHGVVLSLEPNEAEKQLAVRDIKAEYLRLLYVALTRAKYGCYVWLMNVPDGRSKKSLLAKTALGYLLGLEEKADAETVAEHIADIQNDINKLGNDHNIPAGSLFMGEMPDWCQQLHTAVNQKVTTPAVYAKEFKRNLYDSWRVSSYSQLAADHTSPSVNILANNNPDDVDWQDDDLQLSDWQVQQEEHVDHGDLNPSDIRSEADVFALCFPKGANPGTCLHSILEHWDFKDRQALTDICQTQLPYYSLADNDVSLLAEWLMQVANTPLFAHQQTFTLSQLSAAQRLDEMEFYLPVGSRTPADTHPQTSTSQQALTASKINRLLPDKHLSFESLNGYLKGFIDLIFIYEGRYYVADYKSNHLGYRADDYQHSSLVLSMADHDYDLQAWIYTLALDRLLAQRLTDYDPHTHLGGVFYFYLRGMVDEFKNNEADESVIGQHPGVFYQAIDVAQLHQWRACFFPEKEGC